MALSDAQKAQLRAAILAEMQKRQAAEAPKSDIDQMGAGYRFMGAVGRGVAKNALRAVNLALPDAITPEFASDEALARYRKEDEPLLAYTSGKLGDVAGDIVSTLPIGGAVGAVGKGLARVPALSRALSMAGKVPGAGRVAATGRAALEGALTGGVLSEPGEFKEGAVTGAKWGGALGALGQVGGAVATKIRPKITEEARKLMDDTGGFVPSSQALPEDSVARQVGAGALANIPGQKLRAQDRVMKDIIREEVFSQGLPYGVPVNSVFQSGDDTYTALKHAKKAWAHAFDDTNKAVVKGFDVPKDIADDLLKYDSTLTIPQVGRRITGRAMADFKQAVNDLASRSKAGALTRASRSRLYKMANTVDKRMYRDLLAQNARDQFGEPLWKQYAINTKNYGVWQKIQAAAKKAAGGEFTPQQWESVTRRSNLREPIKDFADTAAKAMPKFPSNPGIFQLRAALGLLPMAGGFAGGTFAGDSIPEKLAYGALGAGAVYGGMKGVTSQPWQRTVFDYGDDYGKALREYLGRAVRAGTISANVGDE